MSRGGKPRSVLKVLRTDLSGSTRVGAEAQATSVEILTAGRDLWARSCQRAFWRGGAWPGRLAETGTGGQER